MILGASASRRGSSSLRLEDGSRVAVVGGGPAGSFFTYFCLELADHIDLKVAVDIYEPKNFANLGPGSCNMCGGIVSESLVQLLAAEGINLPESVVQRGIDSYVLHMDVGSVGIDPPGREKRIAAVHRGGGPRGSGASAWRSFDGFLLGLAEEKGATLIPKRVERIRWDKGRPCVVTKDGESPAYDLLVMAVGINGLGPKLLATLGLPYSPPRVTKAFICELPLGADSINAHLGSAMHVFLLNLPRLEFAALIPKGDYVTGVLLGTDIDKELVAAFLKSPEVRRCLPPDWRVPEDYCHCSPSINIHGAARPLADRLVFLGDCAENRLYKDGIGGSYRAGKAAAAAAILHGVSEKDLRRHYLPCCRKLARDNAVGKVVFAITRLIQYLRFTRRGLLRMVTGEQGGAGGPMSHVLWDTFTGSAPYRDVFLRAMKPLFLVRFLYEIVAGVVFPGRVGTVNKMNTGALGKLYPAGEVIIRQGEVGHSMFVIQSGKAEVIKSSEGHEICLAELGEGDFFGEMDLFGKETRTATVRTLTETRVLTIDQKLLLRKIQEDPSLGFRIIQKMSARVRDLEDDLMCATRTRLRDVQQLL